jgi:hypothetical protein
MLKTIALIRTAFCLAAIVAAGGAQAANGELTAQADVRGSQADPSCKGSGLGEAPIALADQAPGQWQTDKPQAVAGYIGPKDVKLVYACPSRTVPTV